MCSEALDQVGLMCDTSQWLRIVVGQIRGNMYLSPPDGPFLLFLAFGGFNILLSSSMQIQLACILAIRIASRLHIP